MRPSWLLVVALALAGCTGTSDPGRGQDAPGATDDPGAEASPWVDLAVGLTYNGTGPTALVAEMRVGTAADCDLTVAGEFNATATGVGFMAQFREEGAGSSGGTYHRQTLAVQAGPVDTRSAAAGGPSASEKKWSIGGDGSLFVGMPNAQPNPEVDWVPEGTVLVTSTCPGAQGRWTVVGVDPFFFTPETPDGAVLASAAPAILANAVVAAKRGFDHDLGTPKAMLVANIYGDPAGVLDLTSPGGTESWNLVTSSRIWHEGPGGQQSLEFSFAGAGFLVAVLFGVPA